MGENDDLEAMESRLKKLELKMFGNISLRDEKYPEVMPVLSNVAAKLNEAIISRPKLSAAMNSYEDLSQYLDPACPDTQDSTALADLLLTQEDLWTQRLKALETVQRTRHVLDSKPIMECVSSADGLVQASLQQTELDSLEAEQAVRVTHLLDSYNSILNTLSGTFAQMDAMVTRAEMAAEEATRTHDD